MQLYSTTGAPNPRRVRIFLAEKGIEVPIEEISIMEQEHKTEEYRKISLKQSSCFGLRRWYCDT